ncbi:MAG: ion transporter, partial [Nitrospira sp.]
MEQPKRWWSAFRAEMAQVIFGHDTPAGKAFDVALIAAILASVTAVMLESVATIRAEYGTWLKTVEWGFTLLFTVEYVARLICVQRRLRYATSFFGLIDLASIVPTYISVAFPGTQYLLVIRILRVLRVFRILKLAEYVGEADVLMEALRASRRKIAIFIATVFAITVVCGALIYLIEGRTPGFTSIPKSIYWTIVTITTVGYGDIAPQTAMGQLLASAVMLLGYAIVAVPTGIVTVELSRVRRGASVKCATCASAGHDDDAKFCKRCGGSLAAPAA